MKKIIQSKPFKMFIIFLVFTLIYILTFHLKLIRLIPVYTYYGIISLCILTILLGFLLWIYGKKIKYFDIKDSIIIILLCFFINLFIFCMVPVTLERSISVFMLQLIDDGKYYTKEEIEETFINEYIYEYGAFEKRFEEQIYTGTMEQKEDTYFISKKGNFLVDCFHFIKKIYNVKGKILE